MNKLFPDSEIARKLTSARTKTKAIISGVSSHIIETGKTSMANIPFCGVATDASNHVALKIFRLDSVF
jgi:hypothetical protein